MTQTFEQIKFSQAAYRKLFYLALGLIFVAMTPTVTSSPSPWMDEVMIVEYGRTLLTGDTTYGMNSFSFSSAAQTPFFLGPILQELVYRIGGHFGIRAASVLFAVASVVLVFRLATIRHRANRFLPILLGLSMLFSVNFAQSYRSGRLDSWAVFLFLMSVCLLETINDRNSTQRLWVSSTLMSLAVLIWPTAAILALVWIYFAFFEKGDVIVKVGSRAKNALIIGITVCIAAFLLWAFKVLFVGEKSPVWTHVSSVVSFTDGLGHRTSELARSLVKDIAVVTACLYLFGRQMLVNPEKKALALLLTVLLVASVVFASLPYVHRYIYLFAVLILALPLIPYRASVREHRFLLLALGLSCLVGAAIQLGGRTYIALARETSYSEAVLAGRVADVNCERGERVYLDPFEYYFVLRRKHCRLDRFTWSVFPDAELLTNLSQYDYVIVKQESPIHTALIRHREIERVQAALAFQANAQTDGLEIWRRVR